MVKLEPTPPRSLQDWLDEGHTLDDLPNDLVKKLVASAAEDGIEPREIPYGVIYIDHRPMTEREKQYAHELAQKIIG